MKEAEAKFPVVFRNKGRIRNLQQRANSGQLSLQQFKEIRNYIGIRPGQQKDAPPVPGVVISLQQKIKLSVCITVFNAGKYLSYALESVLNQVTLFDYEILIGEDCSTDNSVSIIKDFERRNPRNIHVIYNERNLGYAANLLNLVGQARGEYIAQIDADDVILSNNKFQLLVSFLDENPACPVCVHNYKIIDEFHNMALQSAIGNEYKHQPMDYFLNNVVPGGMGIWRRNALPSKLPAWLWEAGTTIDYAIYMMASANKPVGYFPQVLMGYRKHGESLTSINLSSLAGKARVFETNILLCKNFKRHYGNISAKYKCIYKSGISHYGFLLSYVYLAQGRLPKFLLHFFKAFINWPFFSVKQHKDYLYVASPRLFANIKAAFSRPSRLVNTIAQRVYE